MSRPLRIQHEKAVYFVSNFCIQAEYLLLPTQKLLEIKKGALARAVKLHEVDIFGFQFLPDSFNIILSAPLLNLPEFMKSFQSMVAREVNRHLGRKGKFFETRYRKTDLVDDEAVLEKFIQLACAPIERRFVQNLTSWSGLNAWHYTQNLQAIRGSRLNRTLFAELKRRSKRKRNPIKLPKNAGIEAFSFQLKRLPGLDAYSPTQYVQYLRQLIQLRASELQRTNANTAAKYIGMKKLLKHSWRRQHRSYTRPPHKLCHGNAQAAAQFYARHQEITRAYRAAMEAFKQRDDASKFPSYTCRPSLWICEKRWRSLNRCFPSAKHPAPSPAIN